MIFIFRSNWSEIFQFPARIPLILLFRVSWAVILVVLKAFMGSAILFREKTGSRVLTWLYFVLITVLLYKTSFTFSQVDIQVVERGVYARCLGIQGVQEYRVSWNKGCLIIQGVKEYRVSWNTGCPGIQGVLEYRVSWNTVCPGIQGVQEYRVSRNTE